MRVCRLLTGIVLCLLTAATPAVAAHDQRDTIAFQHFFNA